VSRVAMCEVRSKEKTANNEPQINIYIWSVVKINGLWWTLFDVKWKNATHPVDRQPTDVLVAIGSLWPLSKTY
jgi:hypothetical protein